MANHAAATLLVAQPTASQNAWCLGFGNISLSPEQRWTSSTSVRLSRQRSRRARSGSGRLAPPTIVAPDVGYTTGVGAERSLRGYRPTVILLVFLQLPASLERLTRLGRDRSHRADHAMGAGGGWPAR